LREKRKRRLVRRLFAERYLLIVLVGFSVSVSLTRLFLEITGYPQLGNSELHIAHALWGGLILFTGSLLPLIFANKRALDLSALFSGIGVGLFIDEIGKLLTQTNDYFNPAAAPIIYSFFLITLLIFTLVKRDFESDERTRLFQIMERFEEILEGDLSVHEYAAMKRQLANIDKAKRNDHISRLSGYFSGILDEEESWLIAHRLDFLEKTWDRWLQFENKFFSTSSINTILILLWLISGLLYLFHGISAFVFTENSIVMDGILGEFFYTSLIGSDNIPLTGWVRLGGEVLLGACLIVSAFLAWIKKNRLALDLSFFSLIGMIVLINIFVFYFDQFSAIIFTSIQFMVLFITVRYRGNYKRLLNL
jgi:hypothetical protein